MLVSSGIGLIFFSSVCSLIFLSPKMSFSRSSRSRGTTTSEYINPGARREFGDYMSAKYHFDGSDSREYIDPQAEEEFFNRLSQEWSAWSADGRSSQEYINPAAEREFFHHWDEDVGEPDEDEEPEEPEATNTYDGYDSDNSESSEEYVNPQAVRQFFGGHGHAHLGHAEHVVSGSHDGTPTRSRRRPTNAERERYFKPNVPLNDLQKKYCRCTAHVRAGQPKWCLQEHAWYQQRNNETCYNPYAVCKDSTGYTENVECSQYFNFEAFPDGELEAYARERLIPVPQPYNREQLIRRLEDYAQTPEFSRGSETGLSRSMD